ncbi:uncharacterized protein METZ01_LOCUS468416 [marine metagenome]|uniref:Uncharacterized protein n=1 Tax=marine metagenome TaxID=408172 RepID=A0A383B6D2_9ZZZZ|tara:strand:+ start:1341 stop:1832 length:492 start_codon:yes stop_codon:yes gene_type:complete
MEGLAYWLFIAALYFLSTLMKKRQQKIARNKLDQEDTVSDNSDFIKTEPETMNDFFDQLKNYGKEFLDLDEVEDKEYVIQEEEYVDKEIDIDIPSEEISRAVFDDLSEETMEPIHKEYRITKKQNQNISLVVNSLLNDNDKVKKAIILKEIFDKPRALRRLTR